MAYTALEIAKFVISHEHGKRRSITNLRLQKLLYFIQAKVLVETGNPCFDDEMEAWEYGPVVPMVYEAYRKYRNLPIDEDTAFYLFEDAVKDNIIEVLDFLGDTSTFELVQITHAQAPWIEARKKENRIISKDSIKEFFEAA